jgi:hypothetical protein
MFLLTLLLICLAHIMSEVDIRVPVLKEPQVHSEMKQENLQTSLCAELHTNLPAVLHSD